MIDTQEKIIAEMRAGDTPGYSRLDEWADRLAALPAPTITPELREAVARLDYYNELGGITGPAHWLTIRAFLREQGVTP